MSHRQTVQCDFEVPGTCKNMISGPNMAQSPIDTSKITAKAYLAFVQDALEILAVEGEGWLTTANGKHFCPTHRPLYEPSTD